MLSSFFRRIAPFLLLAVLLSACHTAQRYLETGDYDGAIDYCVHKLQGKKKKKAEYVQGLERAFQKAQTRDLATIDHLANENRPENWERINAVHRDIRRRQNKVIPLTPLSANDGYQARFEFLDIAKLESESRNKAAEYVYNQAKDNIARGERGEKQAARDAYYALLDLEKRYFKNYKDKNELMQQARDLGTSYVLFEVKNQSNTVLPRAFAERILALGKTELDSEWKAFYFDSKSDMQFDYKVIFKVRQIDISPERIHEREYTDEKEIEDGWDYVLDSKGNVLKDSLGNDVKTRRYVHIRAHVVEVFQSKAARLTGLIEVYDAARNTMLENRDLGTEVLFENYASTFTGDKRALTQDSKARIGNRPLPFPLDEDMLVQAAERLKPNLRDELRRSKAIY